MRVPGQVYLATNRELRGAVSVPHSPMSLVRDASILTNAHWLPWLIKGLKGEDINAPVEDAADGSLPVGLCARDTWDGILILGSSGWPAYSIVG